MRSPGRYSSATNRYGPEPMGSVTGRFGGVSASRRGIIIGTMAPGFAKASSTKPNGSRNCSWKRRASIGSSALVAPINSPPKASRVPQRRRLAVQSSDVTALPSWKESPSRKAKVQVMLSALRFQCSIICGIGSQRSFTAKSVSKTRYEKSRVVKLVVKCASKMLVSVSGATRRVSRRPADWALAAIASTAGAVRPARKLRRSIMRHLRVAVCSVCCHREDSRRSRCRLAESRMGDGESRGAYFVLNRKKISEANDAGLFTLLFAEAVRAPRVGMIVPRVMLAQQVLAVVVAVRGAHDRVDMIAGGFVVRIDDAWLMVEFDKHDWTVDAVVEGAVVVVRANPGKVCVAQVIERLLEPDLRMAWAQAMQVDADQIP